MPETSGAWRRIRHRLGLLRRGLAVAFGPDGGPVVPAPVAADPRLAGAPPGLAAYVAAHEPVWFEYDANDAPATESAALEPVDADSADRAASPDGLRGETVPRTPSAPDVGATSAAAAAHEASEPADVVEAPAADAPPRPREHATPARDAPREPPVERPPQRVGFRRPVPVRSEPLAPPPRPTADLPATGERPVRAADVAPDPPPAGVPPWRRRAPVPERAPVAPRIGPEPDRPHIAVERPSSPLPGEHAAASRPSRPPVVQPPQQWPTPAPREPTPRGRDLRPSSRAPEGVELPMPLGARASAHARPAPWPELPERVRLDDDAAALDRDIWGEDALVEELRAR